MSETLVTADTQVQNVDDLDTFSADFFGQKTPEPTQTKVDGTQTGAAVEQEPETEVEVENTEAQDTKVDPNEDPDGEYKEAPPKKKTVQDRIDELVKQREDAKREADARVDALRKEFEDKIAALKPAQPEKKSSEPAPTDLKEDGTEKYALGEFDPQYIRDLTRYTLEQERTQAAVKADEERRVRESNQAREALTSDWNGRVEAAKAEYPDFQDKAQTLLNGFNNLNQDYAGYLSTVLMQMEKGPDVLYYLSNHPEEAVKIVNSGAQRATLALGRIEAKFVEADAQKQAARPKISNAPAPPSVRARGTNGAFINVAPDTDDLKAFEAEFFTRR